MRNRELGQAVKLIYPDKEIVVRQDTPDSEPYLYKWDESIGKKPKEEEILQQFENQKEALEKIYKEKQIANNPLKQLELRIEALELEILTLKGAK